MGAPAVVAVEVGVEARREEGLEGGPAAELDALLGAMEGRREGGQRVDAGESGEDVLVDALALRIEILLALHLRADVLDPLLDLREDQRFVHGLAQVDLAEGPVCDRQGEPGVEVLDLLGPEERLVGIAVGARALDPVLGRPVRLGDVGQGARRRCLGRTRVRTIIRGRRVGRGALGITAVGTAAGGAGEEQEREEAMHGLRI